MPSPKLKKRRAIEQPSINIVPLLDVLLVLVAVLMLLTPFMTKSLSVDLPTSTAKASVASQKSDLEIEIKFDGSVIYNKNTYTIESFAKAIPRDANSSTSATIFADKSAPYQAVYNVMGVLSSADITNIQFESKQ